VTLLHIAEFATDIVAQRQWLSISWGGCIPQKKHTMADRPSSTYGRYWPCAPRARTINGGRSHPDSRRFIWKPAGGSIGQLIGPAPRVKVGLGPSDGP